MREYKKEIKTYNTDVLIKCTCDKCGKTCDLSDEDFPKRTTLKINPAYVGEDDMFNGDLCPECTKDLLEWLKPSKNAEDLIQTIKIWED